MDAPKKDPRSLVLSYLTLRKAIGLLGVSLPFVLALGAWVVFRESIPPTLSDFYYSGMRDVFVGTLCAIGVFLLSYKGYEPRDELAGDLACVFAIGVALLPTTPTEPTRLESGIGAAHLVSAALFFLTLAYFSLVLFTKTDPSKPPTPQKIRRNRVYRGCGWTILVAIVLIVVHAIVPDSTAASLAPYKPVLVLESVAVLAFGASWITKGETILKDRL